jgi:predicted acyltransferase
LTITDIIFPAFLTVYGIGLAIAYRNGVKWRDFIRRTVLLIVYGLLFNLAASWTLDLENLRFTGVLQLFALTGLAVVLLSRVIKDWKWMIAAGLLFASTYLTFLVIFSSGCEGGIPQRDCNPSGVVDGKIFGMNHIYAQGEKGFDPEGVFSVFSAISNVIFGYGIGLVINSRKYIFRRLAGIGLGLLSFSFFFYQFIEFNKRVWSPSFALLTSGLTILLLAVLFYLIDIRASKRKGYLLWYFEAFGRNSFLIYFGKMLVFVLFANITINVAGKDGSLSSLLFQFIDEAVSYPHFFYSGLFVMAWSLVAVLLHRKHKYFRV